MSRRVILLRAVNLGRHNKVPMARLRELVTSAGASDVATFIASGNLVCTPPGDPDDFDRVVERLVLDDLGVTTDAISRTPDELRAALAAHPFPVVEPKLSHVWFMAGVPSADAVEALLARGTKGVECEHVGRELHLRYTGDGVHSSGFSAASVNTLLGTPGTGRNVQTVQRLIDLVGA